MSLKRRKQGEIKMLNKNSAIDCIKSICEKNKHINLHVKGGVSAWSKELEFDELTPKDWKHIGYVSALAFAFDIDKVNV